jgi:Zn-dependent peptidase ImmA (M78 family)/formiminotetrahydrofolate cyclodeaminase
MKIDFLERSVNDLMTRLGAGNAHPGSGSAAAFQGMVSAKMIYTVLTLTANSKSKHLYAHCIEEILDYQEQIEKRIYPTLAELFQKDSDMFEQTIATRKERDQALGEVEINYLRRRALEELKVCIIIPFDIAELCAELAEIAAFVFDSCAKKARGDSQVGLSGAISALAGCISIIRLNVLSFNSDEYNYTRTVVDQVNNLDRQYKELSTVAESKIKILHDEFEAKKPLFEGITVLLAKYRGTKNSNLEQCASDLQNLIWTNRSLIWKKNIPQNPMHILNPETILKQALGYDCFFSENYGVPTDDDRVIQVAGVIDQPNKLVAISTSYPKEVQNFTAAHELGHAILHLQPVMHRDHPLDRPRQKTDGDSSEYEADTFAACFLMPKKLVKEAFSQIFDNNIPFRINERTAFRFGGKTVQNLRGECSNRRELSKKLAALESYNDRYFVSLAKTFGVSVSAMAIRLEELALVEY